MAVVIDEVVITVEVTNAESGGRAQAPSRSEEKQIIIQECVERVLEILEQMKER